MSNPCDAFHSGMKNYIEKNAFESTLIGALLGAMKAKKGKGWSGAGYGALKGTGTALGAAGGGLLGLIPGAGIGALVDGTRGAEAGAVIGGLLGLAPGAIAGYYGSGNALEDLYGKEKLNEIFGEEEKEKKE